ncbi:MAG: MFS transporter [Pseudomonadota bacterium]
MDQSRRSAVFLNLGHALDHLFMLIFPTVVLAMEPEFGRPYGELLALSVGGFIAFGAFSLPAGWLGDRWSRHGMMVIFFIGIGLASIATGLAGTPAAIAVGLTAIGVFAAIYHPVGIAMLVQGRAEVGRTLGINGVAGNLGVAAAALTAGALADLYGWRAAFIVPGAISIALGVGFAVGVPRLALAAEAAAGPGPRMAREAVVRAFFVVLVASACGGVIFNATTVAMPKVFDERLAALTETTTGIGALVSVVYVLAAIAQLIVGRLIDRHPMRSVFVPVAAAQVPLLWLAGSADNYLMLAVAIAMMFFVFGQLPINDAMVARYTDEAWRSRVYAVRYVVSFGASALSVPLIAVLHSRTGGFEATFSVLAVLACLTLAAALSLPRPQRLAAPREAKA